VIAETKTTYHIEEEEQLRANMYELIGGVLRAEPNYDIINNIAKLDGDDSEMGRAFATLAKLASALTPETIRDEYVKLFIGVGRGELLPFASYYLTGFLNEKPLANLRSDMAAIGIARQDGVKEPEDHIASLMDIMAGLIRGEFGRPYSLDEQASFFRKHIEKWAGLLFRDIEAAKNAVFYAPVGTIGKVFMDIESQAFNMDAKG
jgi:TorA maturation chaperone TorD